MQLNTPTVAPHDNIACWRSSETIGSIFHVAKDEFPVVPSPDTRSLLSRPSRGTFIAPSTGSLGPRSSWRSQELSDGRTPLPTFWLAFSLLASSSSCSQGHQAQTQLPLQDEKSRLPQHIRYRLRPLPSSRRHLKMARDLPRLLFTIISTMSPTPRTLSPTKKRS